MKGGISVTPCLARRKLRVMVLNTTRACPTGTTRMDAGTRIRRSTRARPSPAQRPRPPAPGSCRRPLGLSTVMPRRLRTRPNPTAPRITRIRKSRKPVMARPPRDRRRFRRGRRYHGGAHLSFPGGAGWSASLRSRGAQEIFLGLDVEKDIVAEPLRDLLLELLLAHQVQSEAPRFRVARKRESELVHGEQKSIAETLRLALGGHAGDAHRPPPLLGPAGEKLRLPVGLRLHLHEIPAFAVHPDTAAPLADSSSPVEGLGSPKGDDGGGVEPHQLRSGRLEAEVGLVLRSEEKGPVVSSRDVQLGIDLLAVGRVSGLRGEHADLPIPRLGVSLVEIVVAIPLFALVFPGPRTKFPQDYRLLAGETQCRLLIHGRPRAHQLHHLRERVLGRALAWQDAGHQGRAQGRETSPTPPFHAPNSTAFLSAAPSSVYNPRPMRAPLPMTVA